MIEVKTSSIVIHDYNLGDNSKLEYFLTIFRTLQNGHKLPTMHAYYYDEDKAELIVPRGYSIPRLCSILNDDKVSYSNAHDPAMRISINSTTPCRDEIQEEALDFLLSRGKFENLLYNTQKLLCLKTGFGKLYLGVRATCEMKKRAIVIVDSLQIAEQWIEGFLQFSDIKKKRYISYFRKRNYH